MGFPVVFFPLQLYIYFIRLCLVIFMIHSSYYDIEAWTSGCWSLACDYRGVYQRMSSMQITATQNSICSSRSICIASKSIYPSFRATRSRSALVNLSANASYFKQGLPVLKYKHRRAGLNHQHTPIVSLFGSKGKESGDGVRISLNLWSFVIYSLIYFLSK